MKCCKCPGGLSEAQSNGNTSYHWCKLCKGVWLHKHTLLTLFKNHAAIQQMVTNGLSHIQEVSFACPECNQALVNGKALDSQVIIEACVQCEKYFFDNKELNYLLDHIQGAVLPQQKDIDWSQEEMVKSNNKCPVCEDKSLFGLKNRLDTFEVCLTCNGAATSVGCLQKLAKKSLFGPTMFEFRKGGDVISYCRFCGHAQPKGHDDCLQCGRELRRIKCHGCDSQFSEYELNDVVIDRCQICNAVWLDSGEFEKVMTIMPDVKRQLERLELDDKSTTDQDGSHCRIIWLIRRADQAKPH